MQQRIVRHVCRSLRMRRTFPLLRSRITCVQPRRTIRRFYTTTPSAEMHELAERLCQRAIETDANDVGACFTFFSSVDQTLVPMLTEDAPEYFRLLVNGLIDREMVEQSLALQSTAAGHYIMAVWHVRNGNLAEALDQLAQCEERASHPSALCYFLRARTYLQLSRQDEATVAFEKCILAQNKHPELLLTMQTAAHAQLASFHFANEKYDTGNEHVQFLEEMAHGSEAHIAALMCRADYHFDRQAFEFAATDYQSVVDMDLNNALAWARLGYAKHGHAHDHAKALDFYKKSLDTGIRTPEALSYRAGVYVSREEYDKAISDLDEALKEIPTDANLLVARGAASAYKGDKVSKDMFFQQAIQADESYQGVVDAFNDAYEKASKE